MPLTVTTDHAQITACLDDVLAADPVRGTVLGSIRRDLHETAWFASTHDGTAICVRSSAAYPVVATGPWGSADLIEVAALLDALPGLAGLSGPASLIAPLAAALDRIRLRPVAHRMDQRLFRLDSLAMPTAAGHARRATTDERDLVLAWYVAFVEEAAPFATDLEQAAERAIADGCWLWLDDGRPVSMAVRRPVVAGSARIGPVYTPPAERGHGYGTAATAAATRHVLDDRAIPVLFTDLANPVSNAIYQRLGYYAVDDYALVRYR